MATVTTVTVAVAVAARQRQFAAHQKRMVKCGIIMNSSQSIYVVTNKHTQSEGHPQACLISGSMYSVLPSKIQYANHYSCYEKVNIGRSIKFRHLFAPFEAKHC